MKFQKFRRDSKMQKHGKIAVIAILLLLSAPGTFAEEKNDSGRGYIFFAPGAVVDSGNRLTMFHFGGGGEGILYRGIGVGAELGYVAPWREPSAGVGLLSLNGLYQFRSNNKVAPFITAGYSAAFSNGYINMFNIGGGVHWWIAHRIGLRMEFRDHIHHQSNLQYLEGRIGLSFR
jgi:hypothetical protein